MVLVFFFVFSLVLVLPAKRRQKVRNVLAIDEEDQTIEADTSKTCLSCEDSKRNSDISGPRILPDYGEVCMGNVRGKSLLESWGTTFLPD